MKKIHIIRPGSLNNIIGPVGTLKRILKSEEYFLNRGYDIKVFTHDSISVGGELSRDSFHNTRKTNLTYDVLRILKGRMRNLAKFSKLLSTFYVRKSQRSVRKLVDFYLNCGEPYPDIIVFHSTYECYLFLTLNKNFKGKVVCFYHTEGLPLKMEEIYYPKLVQSKVFQEILDLQKYVANNVNKCVFISEIARNNFLKYYPNISSSKTEVILNGINDYNKEELEFLNSSPSYKRLDSEPFRICSTGTINVRKGQRFILEAINLLDHDFQKRFEVIFVGDGPERLKLENYVRSNNLNCRVEFKGAVDNSEVFKILNNVDIFVLMSLNEGLPISIIEAMRAGLPIISTKVSGIPELVNDSNGFLLNPNSEELHRLLLDIDKIDWLTLGEQSRDRFKNEFTFIRMRNEYANLMDTL